MEQVIDISATPCEAHGCLDKKVGIVSLLLLLGFLGTFLINSLLLTHIEWAQVGVLAAMMVLTILATLILWLYGRFLGLKIAVAVTQLLPYALLFTTAEVVTMCIFTTISVTHLLLMCHLKWFPCWLRTTAGACHVVCLVIATVFEDLGLLSLHRDAVRGICAHFCLQPNQTAIAVSMLFAFAQMVVLLMAKEALVTRYKCAFKAAQEQADAGSEVSHRILQVVSHELQNPLHVIGGFADSIQKQGGPLGAWGKEINTQCKRLQVCNPNCPSPPPTLRR